MLDNSSKKRMLKQARELAKLNIKRQQRKNSITKKKKIENIVSDKSKKSKKTTESNASSGKSYLSSSASVLKNAMVDSMHLMLLGEKRAESNYQDSNSDSSEGKTVAKRVAQKSTNRVVRIARSKVKDAFRDSIRKHEIKKNIRKAKVAAKTSETDVKAGAKSAAQTMKSIGNVMSKAITAMASNPVTWIILLIVIVIAIIAGIIGMIVGGSGAAENADTSSHQAQVSEKVEGYRSIVEEYCEKYEIEDYVDLCLAMIQQESSGNPPDIMQTEQSYYNVNPPIDSVEESVDCGTHELSDCLKKAKCKGPSDMNAISLALQGYNFGNDYIDWALKNYKRYSKKNAEIFSKNMCAKLGYKSYGDIEYVPHVLRYYIANPETTVSNVSASKILKELKENNEAKEDVWKVIEKGASLIGKVKYSMDKRNDDGRDNPEFLDCSSFTAWSFHKSDISNISYGFTTGNFVDSGKFVDIEAKDLQPGDIGLKNKITSGGGANHVGIYAGKKKDGTKIWLHCTSSSSTSLTGNTDGAMFGAYTNFTVFRRLKKWNK